MQMKAWLPHLSCLVVGTGLGHDAILLDTAAAVIRDAQDCGLCLVIDGGAIALVARQPQLVQGYMHSQHGGVSQACAHARCLAEQI